MLNLGINGGKLPSACAIRQGFWNGPDTRRSHSEDLLIDLIAHPNKRGHCGHSKNATVATLTQGRNDSRILLAPIKSHNRT